MKKKWIASIICSAVILNLCEVVFAVNIGDEIGNIYSTDIVAYIDDMPVLSYNIGGRTVIPIESLRDYGFDVVWDETNRSLSADIASRPQKEPQVTIEKKTPGNIIGNIYYTDIRVNINGIDYYHESYNIGGITCVAIEDLGTMEVTDDGSPKYSGFGMRYTYNNDSREIRLYTLRSGDTIDTSCGTAVVRGLTANYSIDTYSYLYEDQELQFTMCNTFMPQIDKWKMSVNIGTMPEQLGLYAEFKDGVYSIQSGTDVSIRYRCYVSSNGAVHNDHAVLLISLPILVNGVMTDIEDINCIMDLSGYTANYGDLYVQTDLLDRYAGYNFIEQ